MCGEKRFSIIRHFFHLGSSPRVRGKAGVVGEDALQGGIIPACAGKSRAACPWRPRDWDHPRVCGEKIVKDLTGLPTPGSSPRVRGKADKVHAKNLRAGIIPACAGKRTPTGATPPRGRDHPRVCGEKVREIEEVGDALGSSPRVRGKVRSTPL